MFPSAWDGRTKSVVRVAAVACVARQSRGSGGDPRDPDAIELRSIRLRRAASSRSATATRRLCGRGAAPRRRCGARDAVRRAAPLETSHRRRLVDHIAEVARERAAGFLHVIGNPHAEGFYLACGFCVAGTVDTRFGAGLSMRRPLWTTARFHSRSADFPGGVRAAPDRATITRRDQTASLPRAASRRCQRRSRLALCARRC